MLAFFAPCATDMYLAGFPSMAQFFGVGVGQIQITLSVFFLGLAVGQMFYGPLIDHYGRRRPLLCGIALYIATTALCLVTRNIEQFIVLRFLQAVGGCSGMIVGRAILNDVFDARENARAQSLLMVVTTLGPILAPTLGGFLIAQFGWRSAFLSMLALGLLCMFLVVVFIPETLAPEDRLSQSLSSIFHTWFELLRNPSFSIPTMAGGFAQACMFAFITGSSFVFIDLYKISVEAYGLYFALIACALIVFAQINRSALYRWRPESLLSFSLVLNVVAGLCLLASVRVNSFIVLLIPLWFSIGSLGFSGADSVAVAMLASGKNSGSGSSLIGVLQFGCAFAVSSLVATAQNGTAYPMTLAMLVCGTIAALLWFGAKLFQRAPDSASV